MRAFPFAALTTCTRLAYRGGVATAIVPPSGSAFWKGLSVAFNTGSTTSLQPGAIVEEEVAFHIEISKNHGISVTTEIATLRSLLLSPSDHSNDITLRAVSKVVFLYTLFNSPLTQCFSRDKFPL